MRKDSITGFEVRDGRTDFDDYTGDIVAEDRGVGEGEIGFCLEVPVDRVYSDCGIADKEFVRGWGVVGCGLDGERVGLGEGEPGC